ncbi:Serine/threonine-protein kinase [Hordeum vulgare]|nr:Serine/threonine-protein kinase [Hordeum vulgare]
MEYLFAFDKYKVVGIELKETGEHVGHDQKVVVTQLCMGCYVLVYHYFLAIRPCECFAMFVNSPNYIFVMMDTTNDEKMLKTTGLAYQNLMDIHCQYKILGYQEKHKDSLVDLDMGIIDPN